MWEFYTWVGSSGDGGYTAPCFERRKAANRCAGPVLPTVDVPAMLDWNEGDECTRGRTPSFSYPSWMTPLDAGEGINNRAIEAITYQPKAPERFLRCSKGNGINRLRARWQREQARGVRDARQSAISRCAQVAITRLQRNGSARVKEGFPRRT